MRQSQERRSWQTHLENAIRSRNVITTQQLLRQKPDENIVLVSGKDKTVKMDPLIYLLMIFQIINPLDQRTFDFVNAILRFYCREFTDKLNRLHIMPVLTHWYDTSSALVFIQLLKRCGSSVDRTYENRETYILWYLRQYILRFPYNQKSHKTKPHNRFNFQIFEELYLPRTRPQHDIRLVRVEIICLSYPDFKKCLQFLDDQGMLDSSDNRILEIYLEGCPDDKQYRQKLDLLLETGFKLPDDMVSRICKCYNDFNKILDFIQYAIDHGATKDKKNMTMALINIINRSGQDPFQKQQKTEPNMRELRSLRNENNIQTVVKFLCENGADVEFKSHGKNAIDVAIHKKASEILQILLYYMKDPSQQKLQQVLRKFPKQTRRQGSHEYQKMKEDVQSFNRFLSVQNLLSKRSFSNIDTSRQFSSYFTKQKRSKLD